MVYEKQEKVKVCEEREKVRKNERALEWRTSQAARATESVSDALHSPKRGLSTQQSHVKD